MSHLPSGGLPPKIETPPPGPRARQLCHDLDRYEAPGINTLGPGEETLVWEEALGSNVLDVDGNRYIDLTSGFGVAAVGHRHPLVVSSIRRQTSRLVHGLGDVHAHPSRVKLARQLCRRAPVDDARVYFAASGSDAVEIALKTVCLATGKPGILAFDPAYHGLTLGSLQVTSRQEFREPFLPLFHSWVRRLPFGCPIERIAELLEGDPDIGGVLLEPMVGREGFIPAPANWIREISDLCRRRDVALIADEIFTGFGRTGAWFAVEREGVRPDLLCCGKALAGGLPIGAVLGREGMMDAWRGSHEALHTATFVANPLSCAAALAVLEILERQNLPQRAAALGQVIAAKTEDWSELIECVVEVRGLGLAWGIELASSGAAHALLDRMLSDGLLALAGGPNGRVIQICPPLVITDRQLAFALDSIETHLQAI
ncbi:MAG: aminotransferase class III-fold pyridoxal phosphate-dependent enzyme [Nitrospirae bacterium]|nr:aminotransferase class III-fold pyridoxal phosphate-dependent enzyme [Nitrospirota bacterium]